MAARPPLRHPNGGHVPTDSTYGQYGRTDVPFTNVNGPEGNFRGKRAAYRVEKAATIAALARALTRHSYPPLDRGAKNIVASAIGDLLKGGFDQVLIEREAIAAALDWTEQRGYSKLLHLRSRVRDAQSKIDLAAHEQRKAEAKDITQADPAVARAMLGAAKRMLEGRDSVAWTTRCVRPDCLRTALVGMPNCAEHVAPPATEAHTDDDPFGDQDAPYGRARGTR